MLALWFILGLALFSPAHAATVDDVVLHDIDAAEQAYGRGDFINASQNYELAVWHMAESGKMNGHLLYNLGNCYFRLGELSKALLLYQQARLFLPRDRDLAANIEMLADRMQISLENTTSTSWFEQLCFWNDYLAWHDCWYLWLSSVILLCLLLLLKRWLPQPAKQWCLIVTLTLVGISTIGFVAKSLSLRQPRAMIMTPVAELRSGRGADFVPILKLHHGLLLTILEKDADWWKLAVAASDDNDKGYIAANQVADLNSWRLVRGKQLTTLFKKPN